ncbi:MAG: GNAT family N-acetyltransferase [Candidatus Acidiferrales bacterium]
MLTIERRVGGLLRYRKVWFPSREAAHEISRSLRPNEVVRFFGASRNLGALPRLVRHRQLQTAWVDLAAGPDGILNGMKRKSCRYEIRRAEKMLDRVEIERSSPKAHRDFLAVYNDFAKTKRLPRFPAAWLREYSTHSETFVIYLNGEPLCCHFLLRDSEAGIVRLLYSGSRRLQTPEDAAACGALNRYLHWHEMQRYHSQGFATFDFGGIRDPEDHFSRFKLSFGGAVVTEHYYLLGGIQWVARLGNIVYEKILRRGTLAAKGEVPSP